MTGGGLPLPIGRGASIRESVEVASKFANEEKETCHDHHHAAG
jgi:hypothetical protein